MISAELRLSSSPFLQCPRVHPCECGCIHEDTLLQIYLVDSTFLRMEAVLVDQLLAVLGLKVGKTLDSFLPF